MHIPEIHMLCVAYADNLQFGEDDIAHLMKCSECYERWKLYVQDSLKNREPASSGSVSH